MTSRTLRRMLPSGLATLAVAPWLLGACATQPAPTAAPSDASPVPASTATPADTASAEAPADVYVSEFAFLPGTADVVFRVHKGFPGYGNTPLFVKRLDPATRQLGPDVAEFAALPDGFQEFSSVHSAPGGGPLIALVGRETYEGELFEVGPDGTLGEGLSGGRYNPQQVEVESDGKQLAILTDDGRLLMRDTASGEERQVADGLFLVSGAAGAGFAMAPDGNKVTLVTSTVEEGTVMELVDGDTGSRTPLVNPALTTQIPERAFSTDGQRVYFVTAPSSATVTTDGRPSFDQDLMVVDARAGATPRRVARLADLTGSLAMVSGLVMHPGGASVLVAQGGAIYAIDPATGAATRLTPEGEDVFDGPVVTTTADGMWLAYSTHRDVGDRSPYPAFGGGLQTTLSQVHVVALD